MKYCSSCAREVPDSATVCDDCGQPAAESIAPALDFADESFELGDESFEELSLADEPVETSAPLLADDPVETSAPLLADDPVETSAPLLADDPVETSAPPPPQVIRPAHALLAGLNRRELFAILIAVVGGGIITFGLLIAAGSAAPDVVATQGQNASLPQSVSPARTLASGAKWRSGNRAWLGNQRKGIAFELAADSKVAVWQKNVQPTLVVRCISNRPEVFVFTESAAKMERQDENHTVHIGFDTDPDLTERWPDSADHDALFAPDGAAFARRLANAGTMRFGFTPHNAPPVKMEFHVSGFAELMHAVARQCGMK